MEILEHDTCKVYVLLLTDVYQTKDMEGSITDVWKSLELWWSVLQFDYISLFHFPTGPVYFVGKSPLCRVLFC